MITPYENLFNIQNRFSQIFSKTLDRARSLDPVDSFAVARTIGILSIDFASLIFQLVCHMHTVTSYHSSAYDTI